MYQLLWEKIILAVCNIMSQPNFCSPTARTTSTEMLTAFGMKMDETDGAAKSTGSVKLRNGGSMRGPLAVPNPYSTSKCIHNLTNCVILNVVNLNSCRARVCQRTPT